MLFLCGLMSSNKLKELMEDDPGPRFINPPSYNKAQFCPAPQVPVHPLHRLNADLPEIPAEERSVDPAPAATAADADASAD